MKDIYLIVGLGNPGKKYQNTPHNAGFEVLDLISNNFRSQKKLLAEISKLKLGKQSVVLSKPTVFMNNSGKSVKKCLDFLKIAVKNLVLIHDDIDLPVGKIKITKNRGAAGHKGVLSVFKEIKNKNFWRIRIGVKPVEGKPKNVEKYLLSPLQNQNLKLFYRGIEIAKKALICFLEKGGEKAMNHYNK